MRENSLPGLKPYQFQIHQTVNAYWKHRSIQSLRTFGSGLGIFEANAHLRLIPPATQSLRRNDSLTSEEIVITVSKYLPLDNFRQSSGNENYLKPTHLLPAGHLGEELCAGSRRLRSWQDPSGEEHSP